MHVAVDTFGLLTIWFAVDWLQARLYHQRQQCRQYGL